jgi:hypothetical protein
MLVLNIALCVFLLLSSLVGCGPGWTWQTVKVTLVPSQTRGMGAGVARRRRAMNVKRSRQSNCFLIRSQFLRKGARKLGCICGHSWYILYLVVKSSFLLLWIQAFTFVLLRNKIIKEIAAVNKFIKKNHTQRICHFNFVRCDCLPRNTFRGSLGGVIEGFRSTDLTSHVERAHVQASTALGSRLQRNFFRDRPSKPMVWSVHSPYAIIKTHKRNDQIFLIKWLQISCREQSLTLCLF